MNSLLLNNEPLIRFGFFFGILILMAVWEGFTPVGKSPGTYYLLLYLSWSGPVQWRILLFSTFNLFERSSALLWTKRA